MVVSTKRRAEVVDAIPLSDPVARAGRGPLSDVPLGEGWWIASDGKWYPANTHPDALAERHAPGEAEIPPGQGWWQASDGNWYAPELHPDNIASITFCRKPPPALVTHLPGLAGRDVPGGSRSGSGPTGSAVSPAATGASAPIGSPSWPISSNSSNAVINAKPGEPRGDSATRPDLGVRRQGVEKRNGAADRRVSTADRRNGVADRRVSSSQTREASPNQTAVGPDRIAPRGYPAFEARSHGPPIGQSLPRRQPVRANDSLPRLTQGNLPSAEGFEEWLRSFAMEPAPGITRFNAPPQRLMGVADVLRSARLTAGGPTSAAPRLSPREADFFVLRPSRKKPKAPRAGAPDKLSTILFAVVLLAVLIAVAVGVIYIHSHPH